MKWMEQVRVGGWMVIDTVENGRMGINMVLENFIFPTVTCMKEVGRLASKMVWACFVAWKMDPHRREDGRMENSRDKARAHSSEKSSEKRTNSNGV